MNEQLSYEADRDSSKAYLQRIHAKFIPNFSEDESDFGDFDADISM